MCGFNHPHVLGLVGITLDPNNSPHLLLPFMENGDLRSYLNKEKEVQNSMVIYSFPDICTTFFSLTLWRKPEITR